jgi:hypothetical protein
MKTRYERESQEAFNRTIAFWTVVEWLGRCITACAMLWLTLILLKAV